MLQLDIMTKMLILYRKLRSNNLLILFLIHELTASIFLDHQGSDLEQPR